MNCSGEAIQSLRYSQFNWKFMTDGYSFLQYTSSSRKSYNCARGSPTVFEQNAEKYWLRASTVPLPSSSAVTIPT